MSDEFGGVAAHPAAGAGGTPSVAGDAVRLSKKRLSARAIDLGLLLLGGLISLIAYLSLAPLLLAFIFYSMGIAVLLWPGMGGTHERRIFSRVFAVGFLMSGVAAVYANYWNDPSQLASDADSFFRLASGQAAGIALDDLRVMFEGALAILLWGEVYDLFASLGFPRERYVGILFNITMVAATGAVAIKIARQVYGEDPYRVRRLTILFSACGLFWMFASIHIRDAVVLLGVTALVYVWLRFLTKPGFGARLLLLIATSLVASFALGFLRAEFVFVPIAMGAAGVAALMVGRQSGGRLRGYILLLIGLAGVAGLLVVYGEAILRSMIFGQEGYGGLAAETHGDDSLGMALIVNQPLPVRLVVGSLAVFLYPIPFWRGFQLESAYHLFKSFNVLFFYFLIPLLGLAVREIWRNGEHRTSPHLFMLFTTVGFTLAIAATSVESRHLGAFLVPMFILALLPDLRSRTGRHNYQQLLMATLTAVAVIHGLWVMVKIV
jgi:hypothetical protein